MPAGGGDPRDEMSAARLRAEKARRTNRWLAGGCAVLAAAVAGLGVALVLQSGSEEPQAAETSVEGASPVVLASDEVVTMLEGLFAAINNHDVQAMAAFYTEDAVLEDHYQDVISRGRGAIADYFERGFLSTPDFRLGSKSEDVVQIGPYAVEAVSIAEGGRLVGSLVVIYELDEELKIVHEWIVKGPD